MTVPKEGGAITFRTDDEQGQVFQLEPVIQRVAEAVSPVKERKRN